MNICNFFFNNLALVLLIHRALIGAAGNEISKSFVQKPARLITSQERMELLQMIKKDDEKAIKTFFEDVANRYIDFPLITFKYNDDTSGTLAPHGFTPLSAAIFYCKLDAIKALLPIQCATYWSRSGAIGYSNAELAAKYCPEIIPEDGFGFIFHNLDARQLFNIFIEAQKHSSDERKSISKFVVDHFLDSKELLLEFADIWLFEETDITPFIKAICNPNNNQDDGVEEVNPSFPDGFSELALKLLKAGHSDHFKSILKVLSETEAAVLLEKAGRYLSPKNLGADGIEIQGSRAFAGFQNLHELAENVSVFRDVFINTIVSILESAHSFIPNLASILNIGSLQKLMQMYVPNFHAFLLEQYPRVDFAVAATKENEYKIVSTGHFKIRIPYKHSAINAAYKKDDNEALEAALNDMQRSGNEFKSLNLRFEFGPYRLSLIKTAVMLKKPKILQFLMNNSNGKESLNSTTKFHMTALELAACYEPEFLVDHIVPLIAADCKERLKFANNLIAMFTGTKIPKCQTGAKNAPVVLKALLTSDNPEEISCINLSIKDYIRESIKLHHPLELIQAFWETDHYTNIDSYIYLAIAKGDLRLLKYFVKKANGADSPSLEAGLTRWIRLTKGLPTNNNIAMLEFFLAHKKININAHDPDVGATALSIAVQNGYLWIVKRLLLEKDLDINLVDKATGKTPLHHAIHLFNSIYNDMQPESGSAAILSEDQKMRLAIAKILEQMNLPSLPESIMDVIFTKFIFVAITLLNFIFMLQDESIKNIKKKFDEWMLDFSQEQFYDDFDLKEKVRVSPNHGFLHNVLLSHPDIDTTIVDLNQSDAVKISKHHAYLLYGDTPAVKEMARAHLRIINVDSVKGEKRDRDKVTFAIISSIIVGAASIGIIRWVI